MANEQNLTKMGKNRGLTTEEAQRIGSLGGKKSGEVRRRRKTYREIAELILSMPITDENTREYLLSQGYKEEDLNNDFIEMFSMHQQVLNGNVKAFEALRDTVGERPSDKLEISEAPQIVVKRPDK